jgi:hypothetical protein
MGSRGDMPPAYVRRNPWCVGRGMRHWGAFRPRYGYAPEIAPGEEIRMLEDAARRMEQELQSIRERIEVLRTKQ